MPRGDVQPLRRVFRLPAWPAASLRVRTLLTTTLCLSVILLVNAVSRQRAMDAAGRAALTERAALLASLEASALSVPLWNLDEEQVDVALDAVAQDPDFAGAPLLRPDGSVLSARVNAGAARRARIAVSRPILFSDHVWTALVCKGSHGRF